MAVTVGSVADCLFCSIVAGSVSSFEVAATDECVAFLDIRPVFKGHILVAPRQHVVTLADLDPGLLSPLFGFVRKLSLAVETGLGAGGSFVAMNNRVSQSVAHLHVHVVPRTKGDGLRGFFWPRTDYDDDAHRASVTAAITDALASA
jgi:histidine triad (HIT) family protein